MSSHDELRKAYTQAYVAARTYDRTALDQFRALVNSLRPHMVIDYATIAAPKGDDVRIEDDFLIYRDGRLQCAIKATVGVDRVELGGRPDKHGNPLLGLTPVVSITLRRVDKGWIASLGAEYDFEISSQDEIKKLASAILDEFKRQLRDWAWDPLD